MSRLRATAAFMMLSYIFGYYYTVSTNRLYPGILLGALGTSFIFLIHLYSSSDQSVKNNMSLHLVLIIGFSLVHRYTLFAFPASIVEIDPNWYAAMTDAVVQSGSMSAIDAGFYQDASLSILLPAIVSLITGLPSEDALVAYPIFMAVIIPLFVFVVLRKWENVDPRLTLAFTILGSVVAISVKFSYMPMANGLAAAYWLTFLLALQYYRQTLLRTLPTLAVLGALTFTHKLGLIVPLAAVAVIIGVHKLSTIYSGRSKLVTSL